MKSKIKKEENKNISTNPIVKVKKYRQMKQIEKSNPLQLTLTHK